jgi:hypothetical protein
MLTNPYTIMVLIQIIVKSELQKLGIEWNKFLLENGFEKQEIT